MQVAGGMRMLGDGHAARVRLQEVAESSVMGRAVAAQVEHGNSNGIDYRTVGRSQDGSQVDSVYLEGSVISDGVLVNARHQGRLYELVCLLPGV